MAYTVKLVDLASGTERTASPAELVALVAGAAGLTQTVHLLDTDSNPIDLIFVNGVLVSAAAP